MAGEWVNFVDDSARWVEPVIQPQMDDVIARAIASGGEPPFEYLGAGMTAVVLCDARRRGMKIARYPGQTEILGNEAEWLQTANQVIPGLVARFDRYDPVYDILWRECVEGRAAGWGTPGVRDAYERIQAAIRPHGWTAPEYKEDSFVIAPRGLVLVDAGFVHRIGPRLLDYALQVLGGRPSRQSPADLAWSIRMGIPEEFSEAQAQPVLDAIYDLHPSARP